MANNISSLTKSGRRSIRFKAGLAVVGACATALMLTGGPAQSLEPKWPSGPYRYIVVDQDIRDILAEFGRNMNVTVKVSERVLVHRIRGRLPVSGAKEFLNRLCDSYGLVWYFDGAVLHINGTGEVNTELVNIGTGNPGSVAEKLQALGIADPRYSIRSTADSGILSVSGPPAYIALIRQTVAAMQKPVVPRSAREVQGGDDVRVRVFRGNTREGS
jgi:type III secretion protein C